MSIKENVLLDLSARKCFVSGEEFASKLGVSRTAVWKAVNELKKEGHDITTVTNRGYYLNLEADNANAKRILSYLKNMRFATLPEKTIGIEILKEVDSTNEYLKKRAAEGAPELTVAIADTQTAGKGRKGRSFFSPPGCGLYVSLLLRPEFDADDALFLTAAASVAAAEAVDFIRGCSADSEEPEKDKDASGIISQIKWVNDIFLNGKKICGILTEGSVDLENGGLNYAVLGAGFNLYPPETGIPVQLREIIGTIFESKPNFPVKNLLAARFIYCFTEFYSKLKERNFMSEYRRRSCAVGRRVCFERAGVAYGGLVTEIDDFCRLVVKTDEHKIVNLDSGEITLKKIEK